MRLLDRYIAREVLGQALLGLAVFTFVFFIPQLVRLMNLLVLHSAGRADVIRLFLTTLPGVFTFTIPTAALVGVLLGLGRMSSDSETIAISALGMGMRRVLLPVLVFAVVCAALTSAMTMWLGPKGVTAFRQIEQRLRATQASLLVTPRVFDERFPNLVLYINDVQAGGTQWKGILLTDAGRQEGTRLTLAKGAIVIIDRQQGKLQLFLEDGTTHEYAPSQPASYNVSTFGQTSIAVNVADASRARSLTPTLAELSLSQLLADENPEWLRGRVELHRRLAFPVACIVFALLAVPVGARPRRGGQAVGFLLTILLIAAYYAMFIGLVGLAQRGEIPPWLGVWGANIVLGMAALALLPQTLRIHTESTFSRVLYSLLTFFRRRRRVVAAAEGGSNGPVQRVANRPSPSMPRRAWPRIAGFPLLLDLYILRRFASYFVVLIAAFILLLHLFTFFELLDDISRNEIPFTTVVNYFVFLTPYHFYQLAPLGALVAALATLGVMTKNNEITAFKAGGISLYRLALPLVLAGLVISSGLFLLDDTWLPGANQRQDAIRNRIKGRPAQTFFQPSRRWIFGENTKVYNYDFFDADQQIFGGLSVFELDPQTFQLQRRVYATRARWAPALGTWILEAGWVRDFQGPRVASYHTFPALTLPELTEPPGYFHREVRQSSQMNWHELRNYIAGLHQAGFDVARLSVQLEKKFAYPLIAPISILLAIPFAFLVGTRGAVGGLALGVAFGIAYWAISALLEAMGAVGQLPPFLAGWAPTGIFAFLGIYFFLKMPT